VKVSMAAASIDARATARAARLVEKSMDCLDFV
jgi:hypothetical protein